MNKEKEMRNKSIWDLRQKGATLEAIGKDFDLTRERIRAICEKEKNKIAKQIRNKNEKV